MAEPPAPGPAMAEPPAPALPIAPPAVAWAQQPERSNALALQVMSRIAVWGGRGLARAVLHPITLYFLLTSAATRRHSARYLARALGRAPTWADRYRHLHAFAATVLDRVYLLRGQFERFDFRVTGAQALALAQTQGRGALLVGAHLGSFEAIRAVGLQQGAAPIAFVMYPDNARLVAQALRAIAPQAQQPTLIALGRMDSMLAIRDWLAAGGLAGMLGDRTLGVESERGTVRRLPFLGREAPFSDGPFRLAALLRCPVSFMVGLYRGGRGYDVRVLPLADFSVRSRDAAEREQRIDAAVRRYVATLEALCREAPYNWFNFHDHWQEDGEPPVARD